MAPATRYQLMDRDDDSEVNALLTKARELRRQADETALPWYRQRLLKLARDVEMRAGELEHGEETAPTKKGPDNVRPFRQS
jgi:hypothetical protein